MLMRTFYTIALYMLALPIVNALDILDWQTDKNVSTYLVQRTELPMLDIQIIFDAGSARDGELYGLANLTAAMLKQGAGGLSSDELAKRFDDNGAEYVATVAKDTSVLSLRVLSDDAILNNILDTLVLMLNRPDFPNKNLQRLVKQNLTEIEKAKRLPGQVANRAFNRALFGKHPYAHSVIGAEDTLRHIDVKKLHQFRNQYLTAQNAIIILVGDVSVVQAKQIANKISAALPQGNPAPPLPALTPPKPQRINIPFDSAQTHVYIGQLGIGFNDADFFPLYLGNRIFGGSGFASRLVQEVRVKNGYVYSVWSYFSPLKQEGIFTIGFQTQNNQAKNATDLVLNMLEQLRQDGVKKTELDLAKDSVRGGFPLRIASNRSIATWVGRIAFYNLDINYLEHFVPQVEQVTQSTIRDALQKRIDTDNLIVVTVGG